MKARTGYKINKHDCYSGNEIICALFNARLYIRKFIKSVCENAWLCIIAPIQTRSPTQIRDNSEPGHIGSSFKAPWVIAYFTTSRHISGNMFACLMSHKLMSVSSSEGPRISATHTIIQRRWMPTLQRIVNACNIDEFMGS